MYIMGSVGYESGGDANVSGGTMKRALVLVVVAAFLVSAVSVFAEYNKEATVKAMRENLAGLSKARAAAGTGDFYAAADGLMAIGKNAVMLSAMDPPKGDKAAWEAGQKELARAAFKGIGACASSDKAVLDAALAEVGAAMRKGHGAFRG